MWTQIAPSFLIRSSSNLWVTRTAIKSWTSSISGRIRLLTSELHTLERVKKSCGHDSAFIFYRIFVKLQGNQDKYKISYKFDFQPDWTIHFGFTCP